MTKQSGEQNFPRAEDFYRGLGIGRTEAKAPHLSLPQQVAHSLQGLQAQHGGKNLAEFFDGREGRQVAQSTISRWIADPVRFSATFQPVLVELDPSFGLYLLRSVPVWMGLDRQVLEQLPRQTADEVRSAYERVLLEQIGPWKGTP